MIQIVTADGAAEQKIIGAMRARAAAANMDITRAVSAILEDVRVRGMRAVEEYSLRFDGTVPYEIRGKHWRRLMRPVLNPSSGPWSMQRPICDCNEKLLVKKYGMDLARRRHRDRVVRSGD